MSFGEGATYVGGMFSGEIVGLLAGAVVLKKVINHSDVYTPLQDRIVDLSHQNTSLSQVTEHNLLQGYRDKASVATFVQHRIDSNNHKIKALKAEQPHQINEAAGMGIFLGIGFAGAVAGTAIAYGARKAVKAVSSRLNTSEDPSS